jgi:hypothetical protein
VYLATFDKLRSIGAGVISVRNMLPPSNWGRYLIPHDGHPTPLLNGLVADALIAYLTKQQP